MRAREFTEALDRPYYLHWEHSADGDVNAVAELPANEGHIHIIFQPEQDNKQGPVTWEVEFWRNDDQDITGEGDQFRVFATVLQAINEFVAKYKPMDLSFTATKKVEPGQKSQSRASLYDALVKRYAQRAGYRTFRGESGDSVVYHFQRITPNDKAGVAESVNDYLWHGSREEHKVLYPRQAMDTGGKEESNKNAVYATPNAKVAIAMGLTTPGSDTGMFPNDPQMVLFKGNIRKGQMVYLHKVPKDLFIKHNGREWYSKPGVEAVKPIEVVKVPVDKYLNLIRQATPADLELQKKYMKQQGVEEAVHPDITSGQSFEPTEKIRMGEFEFQARIFRGRIRGHGNPNDIGVYITAHDPKLTKVNPVIGWSDQVIGYAHFVVKSDEKGNQWLESDFTEVDENYEGRGVAARMYAFAKSLGNDIKPSPDQSSFGKRMWKKWGKDAKHLVGEQGVAEGAMKDLDIDLQDQQWDSVVGYVINGIKKGIDTDRMELALYKWAGKELYDVDQALEDHGFRDIADLADHIQQHHGRYVPPTDFGLGER